MELDILSAKGSGDTLSYSLADGKLSIELGRSLSAGEEETVNVEFSGSPRRGLYFIGPDEAYPDKRLEAWTQGEDEDSRHWFPCYDYPNEMATSEMHVTVREPFIAIANGELRGVEAGPAPGTRTFHFFQAQPHVTYLTSVVAGEFAEFRDEWNGIPVQYYVPQGREDDGRELFKNTPAMMSLFSDLTGVPYPYAKYSQVVVQDFIFGGMENVSATTVTENVLYDRRARLDADGEYLVAHELAHQWFGDLLTTRDWSHAWLNEGFATFFEMVWFAHDRGQDEFLFHLRSEFDNYIGESGKYQRPIVTNVYNAPMDLFDRHLYEKGGIVLNMLRHLLGDDLFWKAIRHYVATRRGHNVVTPDLQRAIEDATGRNLDWFFDQWVYGAGHPTLTGSYAWDDKTSSAKLSLKQTQTGDKVTEVFRLPSRHRLQARRWLLALESHRDDGARADLLPAAGIEAEVRPHRRAGAQDAGAGAAGRDAEGRARRGRKRGRRASKRPVPSVRRATTTPSPPSARPYARTPSGPCKPRPRRRSAPSARTPPWRSYSPRQVSPTRRPAAPCCAPSGEFREERAADALLKVVNEGDACYYAEAWATAALGKTRSPRAFEALERSLTKESQNDVIRSSAFQGLGELRDERAVDLLIEWSRYGRPPNSRGMAANMLGHLGEIVPEHRKDDIVDHLITLIDDPWFRTSLSAIDALSTLKASKALPHLQRAADTALDGRMVRMARLAMKEIREGADKGDEVKKLREEVDKLVDENRSLKDRLDKLEAKLG